MKRMKVLVAIVAVLAMSVCLMACGGGSSQQGQQAPKENAPVDLEVINAGFYMGEFGNMSYAAMINNPNKTWAAERIQVNVAARDASGNVLNSTTDNIVLMFPDGTTAVAGGMGANGDVASIEVTPVVNKSNWTREEDITEMAYLEKFPVTNVSETNGAYGQNTVAGEVTNNTEGTYTLSRVSVVFTREDGSIVGGGFTYLNGELQPGMTLPFSILSYYVPDHADVEVYVDPGYPQGKQ